MPQPLSWQDMQLTPDAKNQMLAYLMGDQPMTPAQEDELAWQQAGNVDEGGSAMAPEPGAPAVSEPQMAADPGVDLSNMQAVIDQLNNKDLDSLRQQGLTVEALQKQLGELQARDMPMNLLPAAALVDTWTGSRLAGAYQPPETPQGRQAAIEKLQGQILAGQGNLSEQEVALLRSKLNSQFQLKNLEATEAQRKAGNTLEREKLDILKGKTAKGRILPATMVTGISDAEGVSSQMDSLESAVNTHIQKIGPVEGRTNKYDFYDREAQILQSEVDRVKQKVGKLMEGGVLRKEDESKYERIMPTMKDTPEVALSKTKQLKAMLNEDLARGIENFGKAGYDTSGFADKIDVYRGKAKGTAPTAPDADTAALKWARDPKNAKDPRAAKILNLHGGK